MPNKFEVEIRLADNQVKIVTVAVEKQQRPKAYFGGFRNNRNVGNGSSPGGGG